MTATALPGTLFAHRERIEEIASVLARNGLGLWARRGSGLLDHRVLQEVRAHVVGPDVAELSDGERLRNALTELGTTWVKFGQMLSLRPDIVGADIAGERARLQGAVAADPPGVAKRMVEAELGMDVAELYQSFEPEPFASGSVAQVHRATLQDGTAGAGQGLHDGPARRAREAPQRVGRVPEYPE